VRFDTLLHAGWFNVTIAALAIVIAWRTRRTPLIAFGVAAIAFAIVACGLLAPDARTIVGAPGTTAQIDAAGTLVFPPLGSAASPVDGWRITATSFMREEPRTVVAIDAADPRGAHLTLTQPTGTAFLSPVLLMQGTQPIAGMNVPYDSFAVPAVHRIVKAVLLTGAQAAAMPRLAQLGGSAVIFDVEDETGASLPHGIGVAADGQQIEIGGVRLRPTILSYPAVSVTAIPNLWVVALGLLALLTGVLLTRHRAPG
jgi:hypothetical protein